MAGAACGIAIAHARDGQAPRVRQRGCSSCAAAVKSHSWPQRVRASADRVGEFSARGPRDHGADECCCPGCIPGV
eukprot:4621542-Prymnesium_polylepis.1